MPVEDFLALSGRFSSFSGNSRKREKTRGKRENTFRMKKRLPNLSSAVTLLLLSYLAQSPTGRCQSGRMSTPGKCVYRKPEPSARNPPWPPSNFPRNQFVMSILRFLFVGVWERNGENLTNHLLLKKLWFFAWRMTKTMPKNRRNLLIVNANKKTLMPHIFYCYK